jgi:hypothetical protein
MNMATYSQKFEPEPLVVQHGHNVLVYILKGDIVIRATERERKVSAEHAVALHSASGLVTFQAVRKRIFSFSRAPRSARC